MRTPDYAPEEIREILTKHPAGISVPNIIKEFGVHFADYEKLLHYNKVLKRLHQMEKFHEVSKHYTYNINNRPIIIWRLTQ